MLYLILSILILLIPLFLFQFINRKITILGSDRFYHYLLIDQIIRNHKRPISNLKNFINENIMSYPQLPHLILANIKEKYRDMVMANIQIFSALLQSCLLVCFVSLYLSLNKSNIRFNEFLLICSLAFVFVPYTFNLKNSKNVGMSARGLGLFTGQLLVFLYWMYLETSLIHYLIGASIIGFVILTISQFANQFHLFFVLPLALITGNYELVVIPFLSFFMGFILAPKIAFVYFKGQILHKILYSKFLAKKGILMSRESIWLDWVSKFPKYFHWMLADYKRNKHLWNYIKDNSIFILLAEMPLFIFWLWSVITIKPLTNADLIIMVIGLIFITTTFRVSRFLGEPERYLEFAFVILAIRVGDIVITNNVHKILLLLVLLYSVGYILFNLKTNKSDDSEVERYSILKKVKNLLHSTTTSPVLLCNSTDVAKLLWSPHIKQYFYNTYILSNNHLKFQQVYTQNYSYLVESELIMLVNKYREINFLLIDLNLIANPNDFLSNNNIKNETVFLEENYALIKINRSQ